MMPFIPHTSVYRRSVYLNSTFLYCFQRNKTKLISNYGSFQRSPDLLVVYDRYNSIAYRNCNSDWCLLNLKKCTTLTVPLPREQVNGEMCAMYLTGGWWFQGVSISGIGNTSHNIYWFVKKKDFSSGLKFIWKFFERHKRLVLIATLTVLIAAKHTRRNLDTL